MIRSALAGLAGLTILPFIAAPASAADVLNASQMDSVVAGACVGPICGLGDINEIILLGALGFPFVLNGSFASVACSQQCSVSVSSSSSGNGGGNLFGTQATQVQSIISAAQAR
jgi:hypothetical protein